MPPDHTDDLRLAHVLADDADSLTDGPVQGARPACRRQARPDAGDRRRRVRRGGHPAHPGAGPAARRGTRRGARTSGWGPRRWVVDPIDGTKNYVRGVPVWATLIALDGRGRGRRRRRVGAGAARRWWASKDGGAWTGKSLSRLRRATSPTSPRSTPPRSRTPRCRGWDDRGPARRLPRADPPLLADPGLRRLLVLHAGRRRRGRHRGRAGARPLRHGRPGRHRRGGRRSFTGLDGRAGPHGGNALATNGRLHDQALASSGHCRDDERDPDVRAAARTGSLHDDSERVDGVEDDDPVRAAAGRLSRLQPLQQERRERAAPARSNQP